MQFLVALPPGEEVELVTQRKQDSECVWPGGPGPGGDPRVLTKPPTPQSSGKWCSPAWATPSTSAHTSSWRPARRRAWASPAGTSSMCWTRCAPAPGRAAPAGPTGWPCAWAATSGSRSAASSPTRAGAPPAPPGPRLPRRRRLGPVAQSRVPCLLPRAEQLASLEAAQRAVGAGPGASVGSSARAEFWRLRGLRRGAKKSTQRSREDLSALTRQGHYPPYERVVLREGGSPGREGGGCHGGVVRLSELLDPRSIHVQPWEAAILTSLCSPEITHFLGCWRKQGRASFLKNSFLFPVDTCKPRR